MTLWLAHCSRCGSEHPVLRMPGSHVVECPQRSGVFEYLEAPGMVVPIHPSVGR